MNRTSVLASFAEFGPLLAFFIAGQLVNFFAAVSILMCASVVAVTFSWQLDRRIPWLPVVSALYVLIGGFITIYWHNPDAIIFADTLYYTSIALTLFLTLLRGQHLLEKIFGTVFAISREGWELLSWRWFWFLLLAATANEIARALLTPEAWIDYRFYKSIVVAAFALYQFTVTARFRIVSESNAWGIRNNHPAQREKVTILEL